MAREYEKKDFLGEVERQRYNTIVYGQSALIAAALILFSPLGQALGSGSLLLLMGLVPAGAFAVIASAYCRYLWVERERKKESDRRGGKPVLGSPPERTAFDNALKDAQKRGKKMIDRYLVGFEIDSGEPIWVTDDDMCSHGCVFAKTGVGKTLWLEGLMFQQMARGRAAGFTFIDAKRDPGTLADIILMALITGRAEDLIVIDPFDPVCSYNFVFTTQRADVKARKVLRCGLPPTSDQSTTKHYDRLAADAVYRVVRAMESLGLSWSVRDIAVALSAFQVAYPRMRDLLHESQSKEAMIELGHLAGSYRTAKGSLDAARLTDNLRGIASELHSISMSEAGEMFCVPRADLSLTDAIKRGKLVYYMLPRLEEAESAARMVKVFREDLEVSIGEVTSNLSHRLEDPHLVIIDEGASTLGPTWANLFELARKGRFSLLFGAQSVGGLMDQQMGLSEQFYERVIANVNLKVIMRLGDNRTAMDMSEWIGKIAYTKKSVNTAFSTSVNARELTKNVELNRRSSDSFRDGITLAEDETDLVSPEELKHEMSAEKGLAWFDKGDGILRKGRAIWFNAEQPSGWEGREFLAHYESVEADEIGLAEWVDEHIFSIERAESERHTENDFPSSDASAPGPASAAKSGGNSPAASNQTSSASEPAAESSGPFRLNMMKGFRGKQRARITVIEQPADQSGSNASEAPQQPATPQGTQSTSPPPQAATTAEPAVSPAAKNGANNQPPSAEPMEPTASNGTAQQPAKGLFLRGKKGDIVTKVSK